MSYDASIQADECRSRSTAREPLAAFIRTLPRVELNGLSSFVLDDRPSRWMEINLEFVTEEGISESGNAMVNTVNCHIPYAYFSRWSFRWKYLPTMYAIANHVDWSIHDQQSDRIWVPRSQRPWWKVW